MALPFLEPTVTSFLPFDIHSSINAGDDMETEQIHDRRGESFALRVRNARGTTSFPGGFRSEVSVQLSLLRCRAPCFWRFPVPVDFGLYYGVSEEFPNSADYVMKTDRWPHGLQPA